MKIRVWAAALLLLSGCGGGSITGPGSVVVPTPGAGPVVYGLEPTGLINTGALIPVSGLAAPDGKIAYLSGAVASTATPFPAIAAQFNGTIPLGFAPAGGQYLSDSEGENAPFADAAAPGATVVFRASLSNGTDADSGQVIPIDPEGVVLTSPEAAGFSQPLRFDKAGIGQGALPNAQYATAPFALPFTTTGLHSLAVTVADQKPQSSTTSFDVVVVGASDAAVVAQIQDAEGHPAPGATATITGPVAGARAQSTADAQGVVILFAAPGTQTIVVTAGDQSQTTMVTLAAGQALVSQPGDNGKVALTIKLAAS